ncbi:exported protein (hyp9) [Plasmodium gaboni]|uniref:Exported protein (Hyp9) n=1 Tax=Plasmodium gaboni TaxID=647221 RepID=A0A151LNX8_9APIC|nr:exported protein (hyp9) [Plasmodium gaboni]KYO00882.1 exported protein (hyp9) [Plasmodium gaboni]SOV13748.1 Plasmodium exported protein (hyp9), unknown function [Plasmodium gaboni]SOV22381.1 Plasmodium exported protein (hyp9), unknown function [Plasmodium sp. DRC-Itaito]
MKSIKNNRTFNKMNIFILFINILVIGLFCVSVDFFNNSCFYISDNENVKLANSLSHRLSRSLALRSHNEVGQPVFNVLNVNLNTEIKKKDMITEVETEFEVLEVCAEEEDGENEVRITMKTNLKPDLIKLHALNEEVTLKKWNFIMHDLAKTDYKKQKDKLNKKPVVRRIAEGLGYTFVFTIGAPVLLGAVVVGGCKWIFLSKDSGKSFFRSLKKILF